MSAAAAEMGMERIALISDIHGNMPALEAVLTDIDRRNIGRIFCLGDLVGKDRIETSPSTLAEPAASGSSEATGMRA
jgi:predicted phosphodiesterase